MTSSPRFTHDCTDCQFKGQIGQYDLYYCPRCDGGSGIARYGSDGSQYGSIGFLDRAITEQHRRTRGLSEDQAFVLALFHALPSLTLNLWITPEGGTR